MEMTDAVFGDEFWILVAVSGYKTIRSGSVSFDFV